MLTLEQAVTIQILHQQGQSIKAISRELGISRKALLQIVGGDKLIIPFC
nr:helix-turn-helix domain-containing protein [Salmonella enterica]